MSNEPAIIKKENIETIVSIAPNAYNENQISRQRCLAAGQKLLDAISANGMDDALDQEVATFIEKARKTVVKMNEKRSPLTKLFDDIRRHFTSMENDVDVTKRDTVPYKLQQFRNEYAAKKRAEEERRQRELIITQQRNAAITQYRQNVENDYRSSFNSALNSAVNTLVATYNNTTLENYDSALRTIATIKDTLDESIFNHCHAYLPTNVGADELEKIRKEVLDKILPSLRSLYTNNICKARDEYKALMPSKKSELERAAQASAEEAERIKREMAEREALEAARIARENQEREERERKQAEVQASTNEMTALFNESAAGVATYQPKTSVKKRIQLLDAEGLLPVFSLWWSEEGHTLPVDELAKMFKKQITFCEKLANRKTEAIYIENEFVCYEDEVKAK